MSRYQIDLHVHIRLVVGFWCSHKVLLLSDGVLVISKMMYTHGISIVFDMVWHHRLMFRVMASKC